MDILTLVAKLLMDTSDYDKKLDDAGSKSKSFGEKLKSGLGTAAKIGGAAVTAAATAAIAMGGAALKATTEVAAYGDNIDKMSQKMGLSATAYQEWDAVMQHSGTSIESLQAGMKTLANAVENGNGAFERLGITQEDIASMNNEELFSATITALQNVDNETERTYLAGQLLGRGATELGALLNTSAEETQAMKDRVHELGGVMSNDAVKSAAAFQDSLQDMQTSISGLKRGLASNFLPAVTTVMDGITDLFTGQGTDKIREGISQFVDQLQTEIPKALEIGGEILFTLVDSISENTDTLVDTAFMIIDKLGSGLANAAPRLVTAAVTIVTKLATKLTDAGNIKKLVSAAQQIIVALVKGLVQAIPQLVAAVPVIIENLLQAFFSSLPLVFDFGVQILEQVVLGIFSVIASVVNAIQTVGARIGDAFHKVILKAKIWGKELILKFIEGLQENMPVVASIIEKLTGISLGDVGAGLSAGIRADRLESIGLTTQQADDIAARKGLSGGNVYLNTGELVGAISPHVDNSLGARVTDRKRGLA